jgi:hypothetical protein
VPIGDAGPRQICRYAPAGERRIGQYAPLKL